MTNKALVKLVGCGRAADSPSNQLSKPCKESLEVRAPVLPEQLALQGKGLTPVPCTRDLQTT